MTPDPYPDLSATDAPAPPLELDEAETRLLAALSRHAPAVVTAVEDEPRTTATEAGRAPGRRASGPTTPVFQEPS